MKRDTAICPKCKGLMIEKEDDWFLCDECGYDCCRNELPKGSVTIA